MDQKINDSKLHIWSLLLSDFQVESLKANLKTSKKDYPFYNIAQLIQHKYSLASQPKILFYTFSSKHDSDWKFPWKCFYNHLWTAAFDRTLDHLGIVIFLQKRTPFLFSKNYINETSASDS